LYAAQSLDLVNTDEDTLPMDTLAVKPEFDSTVSVCATTEADIAAFHAEHRENGTDGLDGLTVRLVETDKDSHTPTKPASGFDQSPNSESSENRTTDELIPLSHSPSNEALDLTGSARKRANTTTKRKLDVHNCASTSKEVRLCEPEAHADDVDNCSESSSIVCVKDEIRYSTDIDTDWSTSLSASIPVQGNSLSNRSCHKASISLNNGTSSNSITAEEATNDQVISGL